jgi:lysophospholipase L1-like esterase
MRATDCLLTLPIALVLLGCNLGCDGDRASQRPHSPRSPLDDAGIEAAAADDGGTRVGEPQTSQYLDAPPGSLDMFFTGLAAIERGDPNARVLISQFGDSHTAGDYMTGHVRHTLQAKFGDGGRGLVAAGKPPVNHYYQKDVVYGRSGHWTGVIAGKRNDEEPFGILGIRVSGQKKGSQLWVETCPSCPAGQSASQFEIFYYVAPDRGALRYRVDDGAWQKLDTRATAIEPPHPARHVVAVKDGQHRFTLEHTGGGRVDLFGIALERLKPGVIVDNYGIVGRRLGQLRSWDWAIIGEQLATRDPRLVVLQYGTNEADDQTTILEDVAKYYDDTITRIRAAAPTASIVILGPPDMAAREGGKSCDRIKPPKAGIDAGVIPECEWHTPGVLRDLVAVQHAAAARNKVAFFDTFAAMGGAEQMHAFSTADPRVAFGDHIHFTELGYTRWADAFTSALLESYARWKQQQPPAAAPQPKQPPAP